MSVVLCIFERTETIECRVLILLIENVFPMVFVLQYCFQSNAEICKHVDGPSLSLAAIASQDDR